MNPEIEKIIEESDLDEISLEKLRKKYPKEYQIIINDERLNLIAKDIVDHYMNRGYMGKAMVVTIDRFTAVKMYDKVQEKWKQKIIELESKFKTQETEQEKIKHDLKYMRNTEMAVVVSQSQKEEALFNEQGLTILPHREKMVKQDLDTRFKDKDDHLRIVFVCAMWMTGFDVPPVSTIYLDKPIRNHTLMQAISRANRVFEDKQSGLIVDYYGIFRNLEEALAIYGGELRSKIGDSPVRNPDEKAERLEENLERMENYFKHKNIDPYLILEGKGFQPLEQIEKAVEAVLENDESKILFLSILRMVVNSYTDLLPDIRSLDYRGKVSVYVVIGETIAGAIPRAR